jgi:hypothetical protein
MAGERTARSFLLERNPKVKIRLIAGLLLLLGLYACGSTEQALQAMKPAPETEIVLLYNSDDKGEFEECG